MLFFESTVPEEMLLRACYRKWRNRDTTLEILGRCCHIYDISGRRSERKKWLNYHHDVDAIIFVVSLTGYCQTLRGNTNVVSTDCIGVGSLQRLTTLPQNRMQESLMLFEAISKLDLFSTVPIILLLNKVDLLEQRMEEQPIVDYYPEYSGHSDPLIACDFFADKFSELDRRQPELLDILLTSAVVQDGDELRPTIDELWPKPFQQGSPIGPEEVE